MKKMGWQFTTWLEKFSKNQAKFYLYSGFKLLQTTCTDLYQENKIFGKYYSN